MELNLEGKRVFISGSSRGIGLAIAQAFNDQGSQVVINSRNEDELQDITSSFKGLKYVSGDVTDEVEAKRIIKEASSILNGFDVLVCNVGSGRSVQPGLEQNEEWKRIFDINFFSATNIIEASLDSLEDTKGSIICISSICGVETIPGAPVTYSVAKSALNMYVKTISLPLAKKNIRINAIAPGNINFEGSVWSEKLKEDPATVNAMLESSVPMKKFGNLDDISNATIWLASEKSDFITGSVLTIDGGQTRS